MNVQITEIKNDTGIFDSCLITICYEIAEFNNGTKFVLKINSFNDSIIKPNETIPFEKFIPLYTKKLKENIHLNWH